MVDPILWLKVLIKPRETFRKAKNKGTVEGILFNIVPAVISGIILDLLSRFVLDPTRVGTSEIYIANYLLSGIATTIILWTLISYITYWTSKIFHGKGTIKMHLWLISLFTAPMFLLLNLVSFVPYIYYSNVSKAIIVVYSLYLLFLALKETHGYSSIKSIVNILILWMFAIVLGFIMTILYPPLY
ncbi:MAG: YIP1 family protein [Candidatus Aenigmarchaeota archaeon]|nr:YIP1 family protein [Candidatus Aenigmarchaeota archaeon]